jgi:hypothetical protein
MTMLNCTLLREQLGETTPNNQAHIESLEKRFHDAQATGFGCHSSGPYTRMWNDQMEWITNASDQILLRFDQPADREAFRKDLLDRPDNLLRPRGVNSSLRMAIKNISVSGSLPPGEWDGSLVCGVIELGLPVFFLPHVVKEPLIISEPIDFILLTANFQNSAGINRPPVVTPIHLPDTEYCHRYEQLLRQRLHQLPGGYELSVLRIVHELQGACYQIARYTAAQGSSGEETAAIFLELHAMAFRGIVLSIASLAYHCLGFYPGCPRGKALALLRHLRDKGPLTRRELQRHTQSLNADERDHVLTHLATEGLVELDGKKVTAVPLAGFVEALYARPEFL